MLMLTVVLAEDFGGVSAAVALVAVSRLALPPHHRLGARSAPARTASLSRVRYLPSCISARHKSPFPVCNSVYSRFVRPFQIIFNPTSAAELGRMPKELQLQILGEFRGLPHQVIATELDDFGKLERGGKTLLTWPDPLGEWSLLEPAAQALAEAARRGALGRITVERADGEQLLTSGLTPLRAALNSAGFVSTPRGLRLRG